MACLAARHSAERRTSSALPMERMHGAEIRTRHDMATLAHVFSGEKIPRPINASNPAMCIDIAIMTEPCGGGVPVFERHAAFVQGLVAFLGGLSTGGGTNVADAVVTAVTGLAAPHMVDGAGGGLVLDFPRESGCAIPPLTGDEGVRMRVVQSLGSIDVERLRTEARRVIFSQVDLFLAYRGGVIASQLAKTHHNRTPQDVASNIQGALKRAITGASVQSALEAAALDPVVPGTLRVTAPAGLGAFSRGGGDCRVDAQTQQRIVAELLTKAILVALARDDRTAELWALFSHYTTQEASRNRSGLMGFTAVALIGMAVVVALLWSQMRGRKTAAGPLRHHVGRVGGPMRRGLGASRMGRVRFGGTTYH